MFAPRIYRTGLIVVAMAVIVFGFSLEGQQGALSTSVVPDAFNGANAFAAMNYMASQYPNRRPGSVDDTDLAAYVASQFAHSNLVVATSTFRARTVDGTRTLETVTGTVPGTSGSSIVIVAHRDALGSPATADLSGTATLITLANVIAGETHTHAIVLASTSGSAGAAGAAQLAAALHGPIDAVIALGDLAGAEAREPIVVPWSADATLAAPLLRNTVAAIVGAQTGLAPGANGLGGQFAHLALPLSLGEQAPFGALGYPAVLLSLSGVHDPGAHESVRDGTRLAELGQALLQTIDALDGGPRVPAPSAYLIWKGNLIPAWALRVLVAALLVPALLTTIDGAARARRRGHRLTPWLAWVLAGALPFVLALAVLVGIRYAGLIKVLPAGVVFGGVVATHARGVLILAALALVLALSFAFARPLVVRRLGHELSATGATADAGAAAAVAIVICAIAVVIWVRNPFAAALLVPAANLWLWAVDPDRRLRGWLCAVLLVIGLAAPVLELVYYAQTLGLSAAAIPWNGALLLAGGQVGALTALEWSIVGGCVVSLVAVLAGRRRVPALPQPAPSALRRRTNYAGPPSLGAARSAVRR
jgi:hypothetical protein